jgi:hypothetical protein
MVLQQKVAEASIVAAMRIIAGEQHDVVVDVHKLDREGIVLSDAMIPDTRKFAQQNVTLSADSGTAIPKTMKNVVILLDEGVDVVVRADLQYWLNKLGLIWEKVRSISLLLLLKVKRRGTSNWLGA